MAIEHASVQVVRKPWGVADLHPWSSSDGSGDAIGELWFQRPDKNAPIPALLLKLLFTSDDIDQASGAVPSIKWPITPCSRKSSRR